MENKNNTPVGEENLGSVTGGVDNGMAVKHCFFTPTGLVRTSEENGKRELYAQCASKCIGVIPCWCHGKDHCVDKWHAVDPGTRELLPFGYANHDRKKSDNGYNA